MTRPSYPLIGAALAALLLVSLALVVVVLVAHPLLLALCWLLLFYAGHQGWRAFGQDVRDSLHRRQPGTVVPFRGRRAA